ncbi:MAG: hypothetical protein FJ044_02425, partial [Candidatus Cloacimonetes bacterium]|nr:hypothetical protein [Candidatus Cloacimonadota bacterium]
FGFAIYQEAWQHVFGGIDLSKLIAEWVPPNPQTYWLIIISGGVFLLYLLISAAAEEIIFALLLLPFAFLAVSARRHVHFYFLILFYLFFSLPTIKKLLSAWQKQKVLREYLALLTAFLFLGVSVFLRIDKTYRTNETWESYCRASPVTVPYQAVEFLKKQNASGNIFNRYEWGGFLIWQLPSQKIFVDGRMPAWRDATRSSDEHRSEGWAKKSPYTIYLETLQTRQAGGQAQDGWEQTLEEYHIDWILISPGTFMDLLLEPDPTKFGWQEVYRDKISVVYQRRESKS